MTELKPCDIYAELEAYIIDEYEKYRDAGYTQDYYQEGKADGGAKACKDILTKIAEIKTMLELTEEIK